MISFFKCIASFVKQNADADIAFSKNLFCSSVRFKEDPLNPITGLLLVKPFDVLCECDGFDYK